MEKFKTLLSVALLVTGVMGGSAMAAKQAYQVTFSGEAPVTVAIEKDSIEKLSVDSLKYSSTDAGPRGFVELTQSAGNLTVRLYWWQGTFAEISDKQGTRLSLPTGICDLTVTTKADNPISLPCWTTTEPFTQFQGVVVQQLKAPD